ncbi:hypothetical protein JST99_05335 [Candidatus Dependentiae bacterium]|nr:hypothetical protein [Candidatus Dependentiae bacterium]
MNTFAIRILPNSFRKCWCEPDCMNDVCIGKITIGDFQETFRMQLEYWTVKDYEKQWQEGIERIKTHDQSCLVFQMQDPNRAPWANSWILYKDGDIVHIQNTLLHGKRFSKMLKKESFTIQSCYSFITPRQTVDEEGGMKISEWDIPLVDVLRYKVQTS